MITGTSSGSGRYSFHERSCGNQSVMVAHMPEDNHSVRIAFKKHGETAAPVVHLSIPDAERLWAALSAMAKDLNWKDYEASK